MKEIDTLIVLGHNIGAPFVGPKGSDIRKDNFNLSTDSRINAIAAGMIWKPGMKLLFSTGHTSGKDIPSEAEAMRRFFKRKFKHVPDELIIIEEASNDTGTNAEEVKKIIDEGEFGRLGMLTVSYFLKNATNVFKNWGVNIEQNIVSQEILKKRSPRHRAFIERHSNSVRIKGEETKEFVRGVLIGTIDGKGNLLRQIAARTRS